MALRSLPLLLALCPLLPVPAPQEGSPRQVRLRALEQMLDGRGDASLRAFAGEHLAPGYREGFADEEALLAHLRALRAAVSPVGGVTVTVEEDRLRLHVTNRERVSVVALTLEAAAPHRIDDLVLESSVPAGDGIELSWDTIEEVLEHAAQQGFCGSVLAVHDARVVLDRGFGHADPDQQHAITPDTLFAIGSTPIDFTHGAVLRLEQLGKLSLDDPLDVFFEDVPQDKRGITLEQLRTGRSGLLDFPGIEGLDANLDLSWIDREEFLRRVFASELLFAPGTDRRHSHAAWGLLAAVVEVASGQGYEEFLREQFFGPAGMGHTGHYPLARRFPASQVAVGLGGNVWGEVNSPAHWGPTSWLVLGSGGMVSTPRDLRRWREFLRGGEVLGEEALRKYGIQGVTLSEGGNDRGFLNTIGAQAGDLVIVCSNSHVEPNDLAARVAMAAARLGAGE